jgi:transketolase
MQAAQKIETQSKKFNSTESRKRCLDYRRRLLDISQTLGALHLAPALSSLEITEIIYHTLMTKNHDGSLSDTYIMSKGHGCLIQYLVLEKLGILSTNDIETYCLNGSHLGAHPDYGVPGIEASTGSLGHGLGIGVGIAYAEKLAKSDKHTFIVLSDGELQEGSTWEALMIASNLGLTNLSVFLDLNDCNSLGNISERHTGFYPIVDKVASFNWEVKEVNGHNCEELYEAYTSRTCDKPLMIACHTIKGKGVSYMENVPIWHYRSPNPQEYELAIKELKEVRS